MLFAVKYKQGGDFLYYIYMLTCKDGTLYTGIAADFEKRMREHFIPLANCAKYTRSHRPEKISGLWYAPDRATASRIEYAVKQLKKSDKLALAAHPENIAEYLPTFVDLCRPCAIPDISSIIFAKQSGFSCNFIIDG